MLDRCEQSLCNDFAGLDWLTVLRGDIEANGFFGALANQHQSIAPLPPAPPMPVSLPLRAASCSAVSINCLLKFPCALLLVLKQYREAINRVAAPLPVVKLPAVQLV
jgi:hypothetical protein